MTDNKDGWIEWKGGECPVNEDTLVCVKLKSGRQAKPAMAGYWVDRHNNAWAHGGPSYDDVITAYRLVFPLTYQHEDGKPAADMEDF